MRVTKITSKKAVGSTALTPSFSACLKFWTKPSLRGDIQEVRTSFNTELYLAYLKALKNEF